MDTPSSQLLQGFAIGVATFAALLSTSTALFGDWLRERFGLGGVTKLDIVLESHLPFFSHGWFQNTQLLLEDEENSKKRSNVRVEFLRINVRNLGLVPAKAVSLWVTRLDHVGPQSQTRANENVMALRWSDTWHFSTSKADQSIDASETDIAFAVLPSGSAKFCDFCFYYDRAGPPTLGLYQKDRLYLAIRNIPSRTFSMDSGTYEVRLQAVAENAKPVRAAVRLSFDADNRISPLTIIDFKRLDR